MKYSSSECSESRSLPRVISRGSRPRTRLRQAQSVRGRQARTILFHKNIITIQRALLRWYSEKGRDLPWRHTRPVRSSPPQRPFGRASAGETSNGASDPYKVLVSEIMLQQTQVNRVIPKYQAFLKAFPTVQKLARARRSRVIQLWAGLGYNRRAVYLHEAAKKVMRDFGGLVPTTIEGLRILSGVGEYTAGAVAAFAGGSTKAFLDTNIKRILGRLFFNTKQKNIPPESDLAEYAQSLVPTQKDDAYFWHHALMDLGATVCVARTPKCDACPLQRSCPFPPFRDTVARTHYAKRQSAFKDSDRFWRGRILDAVRRGKDAKELALTHRRLEKLSRGLVADGLLRIKSDVYSLPR